MVSFTSFPLHHIYSRFPYTFHHHSFLTCPPQFWITKPAWLRCKEIVRWKRKLLAKKEEDRQTRLNFWVQVLCLPFSPQQFSWLQNVSKRQTSLINHHHSWLLLSLLSNFYILVQIENNRYTTTTWWRDSYKSCKNGNERHFWQFLISSLSSCGEKVLKVLFRSKRGKEAITFSIFSLFNIYFRFLFLFPFLWLSIPFQRGFQVPVFWTSFPIKIDWKPNWNKEEKVSLNRNANKKVFHLLELK